MRSTGRIGLRVCALALIAPAAGRVAAQCPSTLDVLTVAPAGPVVALGRYDPDGPGALPASLVVAGPFTSAGGVPAHSIAQLTRDGWEPLGAGLSAPFPSWFRIGAMVEFDEDGPGGAGPCLFVAGAFNQAGGLNVENFARWNGSGWSGVGGSGGVRPTWVTSALVWDDDGPGPGASALYIAGTFAPGEGLPARSIARWTGSAWQPLGPSGDACPIDTISAAVVFDADDGGPNLPALYVFGGACLGTNAIAKWDGAGWQLVPGPKTEMFAPISAVRHDPDGDGPQPPFVAVCAYTEEIPQIDEAVAEIFAFDGLGSWSVLPNYFHHDLTCERSVALAEHDADGPGPGPPQLVARRGDVRVWDGSSWQLLFSRTGRPAQAVLSFDEDGPGPILPRLAVGSRNASGPPTTDHVAWWGPDAGVEIAAHPGDRAVRSGQPTAFAVSATGPEPLSYQWFRDGVALADGGRLSGSTTPVLVISPVLPVDGGLYEGHVDGGCGPVATAPAALTIGCSGDWDGDGAINSADIASFLSSWLEAVASGSADGDFNGDGAVNSVDIGSYLMSWIEAVQGGC